MGKALSKRKERVLESIIKEHIKTAQPIGSEYLIKHYHFSFSSATLRNEMSELIEMGFLKQPHSSAGRLPTDLGYQFFVENILLSENNKYAQEQKKVIYKFIKNRQNIEEIFQETNKLMNKLHAIFNDLEL